MGVLVNRLSIGWMPPGAIDPVPLQIGLSWGVALLPFLTALLSTVLGTLYPAWNGSRLRIVRALSYA